MAHCAYCRSTTRNVSAGLTVFCNEQCHDAYFGVTDNPFHTPEALAAAGFDPCLNCGALHQEDSAFCSDECQDEAMESPEAYTDLKVEASVEQARKSFAPIDYDDIPF